MVATQVARVEKKTYDILVFIGWGVAYYGQEVKLQLYKTLIRRECCLQFWLTHSKEDVKVLE